MKQLNKRHDTINQDCFFINRGKNVHLWNAAHERLVSFSLVGGHAAIPGCQLLPARLWNDPLTGDLSKALSGLQFSPIWRSSRRSCQRSSRQLRSSGRRRSAASRWSEPASTATASLMSSCEEIAGCHLMRNKSSWRSCSQHIYWEKETVRQAERRVWDRERLAASICYWF